MDAIDLIIPVFNRPDYTKACLDSLLECDAGAPHNVVIVDCGSRRRTEAIIHEWQGRAGRAGLTYNVVRLDSNKGFAGAVNEGVGLCGVDGRICIMHNDCVAVQPGWLGEMSAVMDASFEDVACVVPRTNYANEPGVCVAELRDRFLALKRSNKERLLPEEIEGILRDTYPNGEKSIEDSLGAYSAIRSSYMPDLASFCLLVREGMFGRFGRLDEDFWPRGYEDKFWFVGLEREGYACEVANRAFVHHFGNATSDGPGFNFPDVMRMNEERFKAKMREMDK